MRNSENSSEISLGSAETSARAGSRGPALCHLGKNLSDTTANPGSPGALRSSVKYFSDQHDCWLEDWGERKGNIIYVLLLPGPFAAAVIR